MHPFVRSFVRSVSRPSVRSFVRSSVRPSFHSDYSLVRLSSDYYPSRPDLSVVGCWPLFGYRRFVVIIIGLRAN